jgi:hypothetical protein
MKCLPATGLGLDRLESMASGAIRDSVEPQPSSSPRRQGGRPSLNAACRAHAERVQLLNPPFALSAFDEES